MLVTREELKNIIDDEVVIVGTGDPWVEGQRDAANRIYDLIQSRLKKQSGKLGPHP